MKRNMQKLMSILAVSTLSISMLAGCGDSTGTAGTGTSTDNTTATGTETADNAATTAEATTSETTENTTADASTLTELPRTETLYFGGYQYGVINDYNPMSSNSNNWAIAASDFSREIMYETLYMWNPTDGQMYPLLALDQPEITDTDITVKLNPDAKWSDGTQVTATDVVATINAHIEYESPTGADMINYITGAEVVDETTVVLKMALGDDGKSVNPLLSERYLTMLYIMNADYIQTVVERNGGNADDIKLDKMEDAVYSGPYGPFLANDQVVAYVRNDNYWGQAESMWGKLPTPTYLAHTIYEDNNATLTALKNGDVDMDQQYIPNVQTLWEDDGLPISTYMEDAPYGVGLVMPSIFFNMEKEGLDQVAVRKAIAMATDYEQIISSAMTGQSATFDQVPRSLMNTTDAEQSLVDQSALTEYQWDNADIDGANALLDEAGIVDTDGDGIREYNGTNLSFQVECPTGWSDWNAALEVVAAAGAEIGIELNTYFPETTVWYTDVTTGNFDIIMYSPSGTGVALPYLRGMFYMSSTYNDLEVNASGNFGHYVNEEADEILAAIPFMTDEAELIEAYTRLSQILLEDCPAVALMYRPQWFYEINETHWTGFPIDGDGSNIPALTCSDGYGIAGLYQLESTGE